MTTRGIMYSCKALSAPADQQWRLSQTHQATIEVKSLVEDRTFYGVSSSLVQGVRVGPPKEGGVRITLRVVDKDSQEEWAAQRIANSAVGAALYGCFRSVRLRPKSITGRRT